MSGYELDKLTIESYITGDLSKDRILFVETHLKSCNDCKKYNMQALFFPDDKKELKRAVEKRGEELRKQEIIQRTEVA